MNLRRVIGVVSIVVVCLGAAVIVQRYIRSMYEDACLLSAQQTMKHIGDAISAYQQHTGKLPSSLSDLSPDYIASHLLSPSQRYVWLSWKILIPKEPYAMTVESNRLLITCAFYGQQHTQIVYDVMLNTYHVQ